MPFLTIQKRCDDCETTRQMLLRVQEEVSAYRREVKESLLDYESLYDKVRVNLAKLAKRTNGSESPERHDQPKGPPSIAAQRLLAMRRGT